MKLTKQFIEERIKKHKYQLKKQKEIENPKRRHSAWKQLNGRIIELEYLKKFALSEDSE